MSPTKRVYTGELKKEAMRLKETSKKSNAQIESNLGIAHGLLNKWKRQLAQEGQAAFRGQGRLTSSPRELRQLRQENDLLRQEREIKETLAIPSISLRAGFRRSQR